MSIHYEEQTEIPHDELVRLSYEEPDRFDGMVLTAELKYVVFTRVDPGVFHPATIAYTRRDAQDEVWLHLVTPKERWFRTYDVHLVRFIAEDEYRRLSDLTLNRWWPLLEEYLPQLIDGDKEDAARLVNQEVARQDLEDGLEQSAPMEPPEVFWTDDEADDDDADDELRDF